MDFVEENLNFRSSRPLIDGSFRSGDVMINQWNWSVGFGGKFKFYCTKSIASAPFNTTMIIFFLAVEDNKIAYMEWKRRVDGPGRFVGGKFPKKSLIFFIFSKIMLK